MHHPFNVIIVLQEGVKKRHTWQRFGLEAGFLQATTGEIVHYAYPLMTPQERLVYHLDIFDLVTLLCRRTFQRSRLLGMWMC